MISQKKEAVLIKILVYSGTILTLAILVSVAGYILFKGIPNLSFKLFEWKYTTENVSLLPALINTLLMTFFSLLFAPLSEYLQQYILWSTHVKITDSLTSANYSRNTVWNTIYYIRSFRTAVFCNGIETSYVAAFRSFNTQYYDFASYNTNYRRSSYCCSC